MKKLLAIATLLLGALSTQAQVYTAEELADTTGMLLADVGIQIEMTSAMNAMYNYDFAAAYKEFSYMRYKHRQHPLPYFLLGLATWWKIAPDVHKQFYDQVFEAYMDTTILLSEQLVDRGGNRIEASFMRAAAYGFKSRLHAEREHWRLSANNARLSLKALNECKGYGGLNPELLFGDALYNYFSVWIPENYPGLRPITIWFDKGDKDLGLLQLRKVTTTAFYTRTEAQYFLMRILAYEEGAQQEGVEIAQYLHSIYPNNPVFHRHYARLLYVAGKLTPLLEESYEILDRIQQGWDGYGAVSGRYAAFFAAHTLHRMGRKEEAEKYYRLAVMYSRMAYESETGYHFYSLLQLGRLKQDQGRDDLAKMYYKEVLKWAPRKHSTYKAAKEYLRDL